MLFRSTTFNERRLLQIILCICKLHILYSIFEFYWLNFHSFGNFDGLITGKVVTQSFDKESGYMNNSGNILFGLPFYRPFGLLIMPQLSGFIFSIGIILQFILHPKEKKSLLWLRQKTGSAGHGLSLLLHGGGAFRHAGKAGGRQGNHRLLRRVRHLA